MPIERWCQVCGSITLAGEVKCLACGSSLKATQPLPALTAQEVLHGSLLRGRYRIREQVGVGGFSAVYRALDTVNKREVAIKAVSLRGLDARQKIEATEAFNREVQFLSLLEHRCLPRIHEHFSETDCWYIAMDFIEGSSLEHYLENGTQSMTLDEVLDLGLVLCEVLEYLHTRTPAIIFRDLKPSNLLLTPGGRVYLIDFGIARRFIPGRKRDTLPFGSPGYAAPEQYGRAQTTPRSDIYSLGAVLHHMLTNKNPELTPFQFAPIRQSNPAVSEDLEKLVEKMVELDATQRPESAVQVKERLSEIVERRGIAAGLSALTGSSLRTSLHAGAQPIQITSIGSGGAGATTMSQQSQASIYYIPSSKMPIASWRSLISLQLLCLMGFILNFLPLYISLGALSSIGTHWTNYYFPFPFFLLMTPLGVYILLPLNILGLVWGHVSSWRVKRFSNKQFGAPKVLRMAELARIVNGCGLVIGYGILAIWILILIAILIVWLTRW